jgi:hypothetical protein
MKTRTKTAKSRSTSTSKSSPAAVVPQPKTGRANEPDVAASYEERKEYQGRQYTGMRVGRSHKWYYDKGEWKETKETPDRWQFTYNVTKRRAGHAPEGSGVPVGTEYHWLIVAHQKVAKLNANDYSTEMTGTKYKVAHKRATSGKWNITDPGQRKRAIEFLHEVIAELEREESINGSSDEASVTRNGTRTAKAGRSPGKSRS